jgi:uncharacterized protein YgiM (DUF1202 family)
MKKRQAAMPREPQQSDDDFEASKALTWFLIGGAIALIVVCILSSCSPIATPTGTATPTATAKPSTILNISQPTPSCADVTALEALNIRTGPGTQNKVIATLGHGDQVTVIQAGAWWKIRTAQGLTGWANSNYLKSTTCGE